MVTVRTIFDAAGLDPAGPLPWNKPPPSALPGVYAVSTSQDPDDETGLDHCPIDRDAVRSLLSVRPEAMVDGEPATEESVAERLGAMWLPNAPVLYIGVAGTSLRKRVAEYYRTRIGARAPHAGGWPIKMLSNPGDLWVHYAASAEPGVAELAMLRAFASAVVPEQRSSLIDPELALPYANLELTKGLRKRHGFSGVKEPRVRSSSRSRSQR
jgi:hypothetical protein